MPDTLLKLLVKDKPLYSGKVRAKEGKLNFRGERNEVRARETDWQWKTPRETEDNYSRHEPTSTQS